MADVEVTFEIDNSSDFRDWPKFQETEYTVISTKMHRVWYPAGSFKLDDAFLPLYIYERQASRNYKKGWVNVRRKYWKIDNKIKEYRSYIRWYRELQTDLDANTMENPVTKKIIEFKYDNIPDITLYQKFFSHEKEQIDSALNSYVESMTEGLRDTLAYTEYKITKIEHSIKHITAVLKKLKGGIETGSPEDILYLHKHAGTPPREVVYAIQRHINKLQSIKVNLEMMTRAGLREKYYGVLEKYKVLSKNKTAMVATILEWMPEAKDIRYQLSEITKLAEKLIDYKKIDRKISELEEKISRKEEELAKLRARKEELGERYNKMREKLVEEAKELIENSVVNYSASEEYEKLWNREEDLTHRKRGLEWILKEVKDDFEGG